VSVCYYGPAQRKRLVQRKGQTQRKSQSSEWVSQAKRAVQQEGQPKREQPLYLDIRTLSSDWQEGMAYLPPILVLHIAQNGGQYAVFQFKLVILVVGCVLIHSNEKFQDIKITNNLYIHSISSLPFAPASFQLFNSSTPQLLNSSALTTHRVIKIGSLPQVFSFSFSSSTTLSTFSSFYNQKPCLVSFQNTIVSKLF
jgi:hypothetical protein